MAAQWARWRALVVATPLLTTFGSLLLAPSSAFALPSYARQTGQQCAACHNGFPELTPYGRLFKLNGYTFTGGESTLPPLSVMLIPSYTHTEAGQAGGAAPHFGPNNNFSFSGSIFYGGAITSNIGAFAQATYDHASRRFGWDNTDIRYAGTGSVLDAELIYGVSLNNNPSVTDVWNTVPAWRFPFVSSALAPTPAAATLIEGGLAQKSAGITAYSFWSRLVYAEVGGYRSLSTRTLTTLGTDSTGVSSIKGIAPYWRLAVEPIWGRNTFEVGTFGLAASLNPGRVTGSGTDHLTDIGIDTQYQFLGERDSVSVQASWITENQNLAASSALGLASSSHNHLRSLHVKATYYYQQTYGLTAGYFRIDGSSDPLLFSAISANSSPNSTGYIAEFTYLPFNYGGPSFWPWLNLRLGAQYIWYDKFNGGRGNFDGAGRNSHDNNTLFLYAWLAF